MGVIRNRQVALKIETTENTAESLVAADGDLLVYEPQFSPDIPFFDRSPARGSQTSFPGVAGIRACELTGRVELKGSGTNTTAPSWGKLARVCGLEETSVERIAIGAITGGPYVHGEVITGGTSGALGRCIGDWATGAANLYMTITSGTFQSGETLTGGTSSATSTSSSTSAAAGFVYEPESDVSIVKSCTFGLYDDAVRKRGIGARGNLAFEANAGEPGFLNFTLMGRAEDWTDTALLASIPYETTIPQVLLSAGFAFGSQTALKIASLSWDLQNTLAKRTDINHADGLAGVRISDRNPEGSFDPEQELIATFDMYGTWKAGTTLRMKWLFDGGSDGNRVQIIIPEAQIQSIGDADRDGITLNEVTWKGVGLAAAALDKEIAIFAY